MRCTSVSAAPKAVRSATATAGSSCISARYGEGELGARAEPRVGRDGAVQAEVYAGWDAVMRGEPLREGQGPRRVRTLRPEIGGGTRLEQQRRCRDRGADAAEAAPEIAPQVEHSEMEAGRRLDEYRKAGFAHRRAGAS